METSVLTFIPAIFVPLTNGPDPNYYDRPVDRTGIRYGIQVGAFKQIDNAQVMLQKLAEKELDGQILKEETEEGDIIYRAVTKTTDTYSDAKNAQNILNDNFSLKSALINLEIMVNKGDLSIKFDNSK